MNTAGLGLLIAIVVAGGLWWAGLMRVPPDRLGIVTRRLGVRDEPLLRPGTTRWFLPGFTSVEFVSRVHVPSGTVGLVKALAGREPASSGRPVGCDDFQDARAFLDRGGERGRQTAVLRGDASYDIDPRFFVVVTVDNVEAVGEGLKAHDLREIRIPVGYAGVVTALDDGGAAVVQAETLHEGGTYALNPWFAQVVIIPTRVLILKWSDKDGSAARGYDAGLGQIIVEVGGRSLHVELSQLLRIPAEAAPGIVRAFGRTGPGSPEGLVDYGPSLIRRFVEAVLGPIAAEYFRQLSESRTLEEFVRTFNETNSVLNTRLDEGLRAWGVEAISTNLGAENAGQLRPVRHAHMEIDRTVIDRMVLQAERRLMASDHRAEITVIRELLERMREEIAAADQDPQVTDAVYEEEKKFLVAEMPTRIRRAARFSLIARITGRLPQDAPAGSAELVGLPAPTPEGVRVTLIVHASRGLVLQSALEEVIQLFPGDDPAPVRFVFEAREEGLQNVRITAWAGGSFLCELPLEISVTANGATVDGPPQISGLGPVRSEPGEVTLQITKDDDRYVFQLISDAYLGRIVHAEALVAEPGAAVERALGALRAMASGRSGLTPALARRRMVEVGVGLWDEMVPEIVKEEFWRLRADIEIFSIAAGDGVPWELLYPKAPGRDEGFLVEQFPVLRRAHGQGRTRLLKVEDARFVVSARAPQNALAEIEAIRAIVGDGPLVRDLEGLLEVIDSGRLGLMHFACHNAFSAEGGGSVIELDGGAFEPGLLNSAAAQRLLGARGTLVFINACRTAGAVPEYTRLRGWAQQFMSAGAGVFVGTLWAVRSESAGVFAESFYRGLMSGLPLGKATHAARLAARDIETDPTWLAYSVYGDPGATITV